MSSDTIELKSRVPELLEINHLDKELLVLRSNGLSNNEIAEKTVFDEDEIEGRLEEYLQHIEALNLTYIGDLSKLDTDQVEEFEAIELSELSAVAERVLSYDNTVVSSSEMSKVVNEEYDLEIDPTEIGKKLRILGEEILEKDEYLDNYLREGVSNQWNIDYLRDNYRENILDLIDENKFKNSYDFNFDGREDVDTTDEEVVDAYSHSLPANIDKDSIEDLYNHIVSEDPEIERLNKQLMNESSKTVIQVSKITENAGGWAPEAVNPYKVELEDEEIYGKRAILKKVGGSTAPYRIEKILDEEPG